MGSDNMLAKVIIRIVLAPFLKSNDSLWRTGQQSPRRLTKRNIAIAAVELFRQLFFFFFFYRIRDFFRDVVAVFFMFDVVITRSHFRSTLVAHRLCEPANVGCRFWLVTDALLNLCVTTAAHTKSLKKDEEYVCVCVCVQCTYRLYITRLLGRAQCIATARIIRVTLFTQLIWSE